MAIDGILFKHLNSVFNLSLRINSLCDCCFETPPQLEIPQVCFKEDISLYIPSPLRTYEVYIITVPI